MAGATKADTYSTPHNVALTGAPSVEVDTEGWRSIYTDGACQGNGRVGSIAGVGVWFGDDNPK